MSAENRVTDLDLKVQGMACEGCAETVAKAAKTVPGVTDAVVDLRAGSVKMTGGAGEIDGGLVADAIRAAGYTVF